MNILSIDSGIEKTGYSIFEIKSKDFKYIVSGLIKTNKNKNIEERILEIYNRLNDVVNKYQPNKIILERLFFFRNQKTVINIAQTQGVVILICAQNKIPFYYLTPLQIKQIVTGYGQADKKAVRKMVELSVKLKNTIKEDDEIDAIACGLAFCYFNR